MKLTGSSTKRKSMSVEDPSNFEIFNLRFRDPADLNTEVTNRKVNTSECLQTAIHMYRLAIIKRYIQSKKNHQTL